MKIVSPRRLLLTLFVILLNFPVLHAQFLDYSQLYNLGKRINSRSISFENSTGAKGQGGKAPSLPGVGRKGSPSKIIVPGETVVLCNINESGTIRHLWITG